MRGAARTGIRDGEKGRNVSREDQDIKRGRKEKKKKTKLEKREEYKRKKLNNKEK